jgi:hypothetical protein
MVFLGAIVTIACGDTRSTCEVAQDRLNECSAEMRATEASQGYVTLPLDLTSCDGAVNSCVAHCVADSTCPAITYVLLGKKTDPNEVAPTGAGQFQGCLQKCIDLAQNSDGAPSQ